MHPLTLASYNNNYSGPKSWSQYPLFGRDDDDIDELTSLVFPLHDE